MEIYENARKYTIICKLAICSHRQPYAFGCSHMRPYAAVCNRMQPNAAICSRGNKQLRLAKNALDWLRMLQIGTDSLQDGKPNPKSKP